MHRKDELQERQTVAPEQAIKNLHPGISNDLGPTSLAGFKRLQDGRKYRKAWQPIDG